MIERIKPQIIEKKWGRELILHNRADYCAKILQFNKGAKFSMHFHIMKTETWYVNKGEFFLIWIDPTNANKNSKHLLPGDTIEVEKGTPHQLEAITDAEIFEASTMHYDYDSYRVEKGDSQC
jgi:mannose-6-phosphate isomerase-like protein (cupin superfamily)